MIILIFFSFSLINSPLDDKEVQMNLPHWKAFNSPSCQRVLSKAQQQLCVPKRVIWSEVKIRRKWKLIGETDVLVDVMLHPICAWELFVVQTCSAKVKIYSSVQPFGHNMKCWVKANVVSKVMKGTRALTQKLHCSSMLWPWTRGLCPKTQKSHNLRWAPHRLQRVNYKTFGTEQSKVKMFGHSVHCNMQK